jgi:hypothetical protein
MLTFVKLLAFLSGDMLCRSAPLIIPSTCPERSSFSASFCPVINPVWAAFDKHVGLPAPPLECPSRYFQNPRGSSHAVLLDQLEGIGFLFAGVMTGLSEILKFGPFLFVELLSI